MILRTFFSKPKSRIIIVTAFDASALKFIGLPYRQHLLSLPCMSVRFTQEAFPLECGQGQQVPENVRPGSLKGGPICEPPTSTC